MAGKKPPIPTALRLELIRKLLIRGIPEWEIKQRLATGIELPDGRVCKVKRVTCDRDLKAVGLEYQALHDNPLIAERVVGACAERLVRIADKAEAAGNFHAAIRANVALVDIVGRRSARWTRTADESSSRSAGQSEAHGRERYQELSNVELQAELDTKRARVAHLRLVDGSQAG